MAPVQRKGLRALQLWCKRVTSDYPNVDVVDLSTSFRDGMAFNAIIHHFRPHLLDYSALRRDDILHNNANAYKIAEEQLGIPALLDAEDMLDAEEPDKFSIATYLAQFYHLFKDEKIKDGCGSSLSNNTSLTCSPNNITLNRLSSESENDSVVHSSSESNEGTPSATPNTARQTRIFNRQELIDKYGEDIFSTSTSSDKSENAASEENNKEIIVKQEKTSSPKAVASVCQQFELKAKISAS